MPRSVFVSLLFVLSACSAPVVSIPQTTASTAVSPSSTLGGVEEFNACARKAGADLLEVRLDSTGRPQLAALAIGVELLEPSVREALARCSHLLTESGTLELDGELRNRVLGTLREFSECMRSQGVLAFPDPISDFSGSGDPYPLDDVIRQAPGFSEAVEVCVSGLDGG